MYRSKIVKGLEEKMTLKCDICGEGFHCKKEDNKVKPVRCPLEPYKKVKNYWPMEFKGLANSLFFDEDSSIISNEPENLKLFSSILPEKTELTNLVKFVGDSVYTKTCIIEASLLDFFLNFNRVLIEIYYKKGFRGSLLSRIVKTIVAKKKLWLNVMLTDELGLAKSDRTSPVKAAFIVGFASLVGSFIPIIPFLFLPVRLSMYLSVAMCCVILFFAGAFKAKVTIGSWKKEGIEMVIVGLAAAIVGYFVGYLLGKI